MIDWGEEIRAKDPGYFVRYDALLSFGILTCKPWEPHQCCYSIPVIVPFVRQALKSAESARVVIVSDCRRASDLQCLIEEERRCVTVRYGHWKVTVA